MTTEIAVAHTTGLVAPIATPKQLLDNANNVLEIITNCLTDGTDFGNIPGTKGKVLFKPGAEKLCAAHGLVPNYVILDSEVDHDRENSTKYGKSYGFYRYTISCILKNREGVPFGNCVASCSTMESKYISRPRDSENIVLKMAQKRALVGAVLNCFSLSNRFTQDLEDIKENEKAEQEAKPDLYDKNDKVKQDRLLKIFEKLKTSADHDDVADRLHGHPMTPAEVKRCIAEVENEKIS